MAWPTTQFNQLVKNGQSDELKTAKSWKGGLIRELYFPLYDPILSSLYSPRNYFTVMCSNISLCPIICKIGIHYSHKQMHSHGDIICGKEMEIVSRGKKGLTPWCIVIFLLSRIEFNAFFTDDILIWGILIFLFIRPKACLYIVISSSIDVLIFSLPNIA